MSFSGIGVLVILQFCFVARIISVLGNKQVRFVFISVIWNISRYEKFV